MVWSRHLTNTMGEPDDFKKALIETLKDPEVIAVFKEAFRSVVREEVNELRTEIGTLRDLLKSKDEKIKKLELKVQTLETTCDDLEQYSRRNSIRIAGIPERTDDNVHERVLDLFHHKMGVNTSIEDVDRMHRVGRRGPRPRAVLVKFATYRARLAVCQSKRYLKPGALRPIRGAPVWTATHAAGLNLPNEDGTEDGNEDGTAQSQMIPEPKEDFDNIFISEDLTEARQHLLFKCRQARRNGRITDCWSYDGQILVKDIAGLVKRVACDGDIPALTNPDLDSEED